MCAAQCACFPDFYKTSDNERKSLGHRLCWGGEGEPRVKGMKNCEDVGLGGRGGIREDYPKRYNTLEKEWPADFNAYTHRTGALKEI